MDFVDKDLKPAITNMFKDLKEIVLKELKKNMIILTHH